MWSRLWQGYRSDIERHNGPLIWLAALLLLPVIVAAAVSSLGATVFATILSLLVRLITTTTAPQRNAAVDRICNAAFGPVVVILMLGFWGRMFWVLVLYRLQADGRLAALMTLARPYLTLLALMAAAVVVYTVVVWRFGRPRFLQPALTALLVIAAAAWLWIS